MSAREASQLPDPEQMEVAQGAAREKLEGTAWEAATEEQLREGLEKAFDYRGDVTISTKDGRKIEGYVFDRKPGRTLSDSFVRVLPRDQNQKISVSYAEIAGLEFSGRDTAAGKSWEAWTKKYWEKKKAGEKSIELKPDTLD
jgi:hypothetical protein